MRANRLLAATVLSSLALAGLTACGSDSGTGKSTTPATPAASASKAAAAGGSLESLPVDEIFKRAQAVGSKVTAVKLAFSLKADDGTMSGEVAEDGTGNCAGTISLQGQGKVELLRKGTTVWLKPDASFLNAVAPGKGAALSGKYLTAPTDAARAKQLTAFCDLGLQTLKNIGVEEDGSTSPMTGTKSGTKQVGGTKAVVITDKDGGTSAEVAIAAEGQPYLLSLVTTGTDEGSMTFSDFDKAVTVTAPPASQVVDGSAYLKG
ncbi:hypothetical protein ACFV1L_01415 [Kitasatospora sp. NPDC059646]|uniref:hypothetical protein n=1 Tax=Kitasatospora sp. NPDC059646 TaxID=3346893 RepID=UPI003688BE5F